MMQQIAECNIPLIGNETDPKVKLAMIQSVGVTGKPEHLKKLLKLTEDSNPEIRLSMAKAIINMGHGSFFPFLIRFLGDDSKEVKSYCGEKLTAMGIDKLVTLLESMWVIELPWMKLSAIKAARQFKSSALVPLLQKGLLSKDKELVDEAQKGIERLAKFGVPEAKALIQSDKEQSRNINEGTKHCKNCNELIREKALKCRYCLTVLDDETLDAIIGGASRTGKPKYYPSTGSSRAAAYLLDSFPVLLLNIVPLIGTTIGGMYMILRDGLLEGQFTFKRLAKLRVVDVRTGNPASVQQSIIRNCQFVPAAFSFLALIPLFGALGLGLIGMVTGLIFMIDFFIVLFGRRRITDNFAGTTVVHDVDIATAPLWTKIVVLLFAFLPIILIVGFVVIMIMFGATR